MKKYTFTETGEVFNAYPIYTLKITEEKWKPNYGSKYWFVDYAFNPSMSQWGDYGIDVELYNADNCFPTKEACEQFIKEHGLK
jgi:hypothetical protein